MDVIAFDLEVNYYPATYVDDSIKFQSAFLVGEIRSYDGDWNALKLTMPVKIWSEQFDHVACLVFAAPNLSQQ